MKHHHPIKHYQLNQYSEQKELQFDRRYSNDNIMIEQERERKMLEKNLNELFPFSTISSEELLPFVAIDLKSEDLKEKLCRKLSVYDIQMIDHQSFGQISTNLVVELTDNSTNKIIQKSLKQLKEQIITPPKPFEIDQNIFFGVVKINLKYCHEHEQIIPDRKRNLKKYLKQNDNNVILPSIIACSKTFIIIDGHHRLSIYKQKNIQEVPILLVNYDHEHIITHPQVPISKQEIIGRGYEKKLYPPKSTKHMIRTKSGDLRPLVQISVAIDQISRTALNQNFHLYQIKIESQRNKQERLENVKKLNQIVKRCNLELTVEQ